MMTQIENALGSVELLILDFDGVLTDNFVYVDETGNETVCCWRSDGIGLARLRSVGVESIIVSTEKNPVVTARAKKLRIACFQGIDDKASAIEEICLKRKLDPQNVAFLGNDINDIPAFKTIGVPIAVADSYEEVWPYVKFRTTRAGGKGAVREVCDMIFNAKNRPND